MEIKHTDSNEECAEQKPLKQYAGKESVTCKICAIKLKQERDLEREERIRQIKEVIYIEPKVIKGPKNEERKVIDLRVEKERYHSEKDRTIKIEIIENLLEFYKPTKIAAELGIPRSRVYSRTAKGKESRKKVNKKQYKFNLRSYLNNRLQRFKKRDKNNEFDYTVDDFLEHVGDKPVCYISGKPINLELHKGEYDFDHIIPLAKGGTSALENLGLTISKYNRMKWTMTTEEFREECKFLAHTFETNIYLC